MNIHSIHAWSEKLPLTKPYTIAYKTISDTDLIFFEVILENGVSGLGAANPFPEVVGETPEITLQNLQSDYVQQFVGQDIRHFNRLIDLTASFFPHRPGTLAAIDIALHDAFGKFLGIPVLEFYGKCIEALPTSVTIGIKPTGEMVEEAKGYLAQGFRILKIKTGLSVEEDIERVLKLKEAFGDAFRLRVDANQGYSVPQLQQFLKATGHLIELVEQPGKVGAEHTLEKVQPEDRHKFAADESLLDADAASQLSHPPQPFGIYNIKLMKCGGIKGAKSIATIAEHAGIELFWGCNDESLVSITAALHAAYSCPNTRYLDLDGSFDLSKDIAEGGFFLKDGYMYTTGRPGLGFAKL